MPIYEYVCGACSRRHEALQKLSDALLTKCPDCGEERLEKLVSAPSFRLAGSGWYETDFKTGNKRNLAGDRGKPSSDEGKKNDAGKTGKTDKSAASNSVPAKTTKPDSGEK